MNYLNINQVLAIHSEVIEQAGGSRGIRDIGLVDSAVARPQATFGGKDLYPDIFSKAACLGHSRGACLPVVGRVWLPIAKATGQKGRGLASNSQSHSPLDYPGEFTEVKEPFKFAPDLLKKAAEKYILRKEKEGKKAQRTKKLITGRNTNFFPGP